MIDRRFDIHHNHRPSVSDVLNSHTPSDTTTQSEIRFHSLPDDAAACQVAVTESAVSEVKLTESGTPTSSSL